MRDCSSVINGLRFYTPDLCNGEALTAYEQGEQARSIDVVDVIPDEPDGVYVLTPDGEHALADLDLTKLAQVEADLKQVRAARQSRAPAVAQSHSRLDSHGLYESQRGLQSIGPSDNHP